MASPLTKRFPRELRNNLGKYLGMFLLLALAIAFTTGFLVAASSIEVIGNDMRDKYNTEDGHFATTFEADKNAIEAVCRQNHEECCTQSHEEVSAKASLLGPILTFQTDGSAKESGDKDVDEEFHN